MSVATPSGSEMLAIILGASSFPEAPSLESKPAFERSAQGFRRYLLSSDGLGLPPENVLYLFNSPHSADDQDRELGNWLDQHLAVPTESSISDLFIYYVGHGSFSPDGSQYALAVKRSRGSQPYYSSYQIKSLAQTLYQTAGALRKFLVLDCCFSAAAYQSFQSGGPLEAVRQQTTAVLPSGEEPSYKGTALLCA